MATIASNKIHHNRKTELPFEDERYWDVRIVRIIEVDLPKDFSNLKFFIDYTTFKLKLLIPPNWDDLSMPHFLDSQFLYVYYSSIY